MPTIYITTMRRSANRAAKSLETDLRAIMLLYTWASIEGIDVEARFALGQFLETREIEAIVRAARMKYDELVERHKVSHIEVSRSSVVSQERFRKLAPNKSNQVLGATGANRIRHIRDYLDWLAVTSISQISTKSDLFQNVEAARELMKKGFTVRLPKSKGRNQENDREGIDSKDVDYILTVINPESPENPFTDHGTRFRNQLIFLMLYTLGVRRGECLGIKIDDINFQEGTVLIRRRADDPEDPRKDQPNTKTKDRKLPLENALLDLLQDYIINVRRSVPGAQKHKFLFVTHKIGKSCGMPLSQPGYSKIFSTLRERVPNMPVGITGHALRHTWNDNFSKLMDRKGTSEAREMQLRSYLMGWSYNSSMAAHYSKRHIKNKAGEVMIELQSKVLKGTDNEKE